MKCLSLYWSSAEQLNELPGQQRRGRGPPNGRWRLRGQLRRALGRPEASAGARQDLLRRWIQGGLPPPGGRLSISS